MENILFSPITKDQLIQEILSGVQSLLDNQRIASLNELENWTAQQTADFCKVSKVTIHEWTKKEILKKYKIGNRIFYKKKEVISAINSIEV